MLHASPDKTTCDHNSGTQGQQDQFVQVYPYDCFSEKYILMLIKASQFDYPFILW